MIQDITLPDGSRERAGAEWGVLRERPCEGAEFIFVDGHLGAQRAQPRKPPEHLGYEKLEREYDSPFDKSSERLLRSSHRVIEAIASNKSHTARRAG